MKKLILAAIILSSSIVTEAKADEWTRIADNLSVSDDITSIGRGWYKVFILYKVDSGIHICAERFDIHNYRRICDYCQTDTGKKFKGSNDPVEIIPGSNGEAIIEIIKKARPEV